MKDRTIQILLITAVALAVVIGVLEVVSRRADKKRFKQSVVFAINPTTVKSMTFKGTSSVVQCKMDGGRWMVGDPQRGLGQADDAKVFKRIEYLNSLRRGDTITEKEMRARNLNIASYGFDAPQLTITVDGGDVTHRWAVGYNTPDNRSVYVRKLLREGEKDEIFTVSNRLLDYVPLRVEDLRSRTPFPWNPTEVQRVELRRTSGFVRVVKGEDGAWSIQQPMGVLADPGEFGLYLNQLCQLRIESFDAENVSDLSAFGLQDEGSRQISLTGPDGTTRTLVVGDAVSGRAGFVYACRKDDTSVFTMRDDVLTLLDKKVNQLRDARVVSIPIEEISGVSYFSGGRTVELTKNESGRWNVLGPASGDADPLKVKNLLLWWEQIVITDFEVATNRVDPNAVIEFYSTSGETNRVEVLPVVVSGGLLVRLNEDPVAHQINEMVVSRNINSNNPLFYRSLQVFDFFKNGINKISVSIKGEAEQVVELEEDGTFVAVSTNGTVQVIRPAVERVLNTLSKLKTPEYITYSPRTLTTYGLSEPLMEVYIGLSNPEELGRVLLIGLEKDKGFCAMVKGRDIVFYLDRDTVKILSSDLVKAVGTQDSSFE